MCVQRLMSPIILILALMPWILSAPCAPQAGMMDPSTQNLVVRETVTIAGSPSEQTGPRTFVTYFGQNAFKIVESEEKETIVRLDTRKVLEVMRDHQMYTEMSVEDLAELGKPAAAPSQVMVTATTAGAGATPQTVGSRPMPSPGLVTTRLGVGETILGFASERYLIKRPEPKEPPPVDPTKPPSPEALMAVLQARMAGGRLEMEVTVAPEIKMPAAYFDFMKTRVPSSAMAGLYEELKKIGCLPLRTSVVVEEGGPGATPVSVGAAGAGQGALRMSTQATSIERKPVPSETFQIPDGFQAIKTERIEKIR